MRALLERRAYEIRFPVVEGYAFALQRNLIKANIDQMEPLIIESGHTPTAGVVKPQVGYQYGHSTVDGDFLFAEQDRTAYYESVHLQAICELGLATYVERVVERLYDAIEPDDDQSEPPLLPILNRYKPVGSTTEVDFKTNTTVLCYDQEPPQPGGAGHDHMGAVGGVSAGAVRRSSLLYP